MPDVAFPTEGLRRMPQPRPLRECLKVATAEAHARLDDALAAVDLQLRPDYRLFLEGSAAALLPLEAALERTGVTELVHDWPARSRSAAIRRDLAVLGGEVRSLDMPRLLGPAGVFGTLYVLEGSRLGARFLLKTVEASSDPEVVQATAYLRHGAGLPLWLRFLDCLERQRETIEEEGAIVAARRAFALFDAALRQPSAGLVVSA